MNARHLEDGYELIGREGNIAMGVFFRKKYKGTVSFFCF